MKNIVLPNEEELKQRSMKNTNFMTYISTTLICQEWYKSKVLDYDDFSTSQYKAIESDPLYLSFNPQIDVP